jgi:hypothetical protein
MIVNSKNSQTYKDEIYNKKSERLKKQKLANPMQIE